MPLTREQFQKARDAGFSVEQIAGFEEKRTGEAPQTPSPEELAPETSPIKETLGSILEDYATQQSLVPESMSQAGADISGAVPPQVQPGLDMAAQTAKGMVFPPAMGFGSQLMVDEPVTAGTAIAGGPALAGISSAATGLAGGLGLRTLAGLVMRTPKGKDFLNTIISKASTEEGAVGLNPLTNIGSKAGRDFLGKQTPQTLTKGIEIATEILGGVGTAVADDTLKTLKPVNRDISGVVDKYYFKGVNPGAKNIKSQGGINKVRAKATSAVETVVDNIDNIKYSDGVQEITGKLPESLDEFSTAIAQTKKKIFTEYDELVKQTGNTGVTVELDDIADELIDVASRKEIGLVSPTSEKYAMDMAQRLEDTGGLSLGEAQDVIETMNQKLKAFYRNPSPDDASKAVFDSFFANKLRQKVNTAVENTTHKNFTGLKKQYGALSEVEEHVARAAFTDAKKSGMQLIDMSNIFTVSDMISGVATMSPGRFIKGATGFALRKIYKSMTSQNKMVKKMFEQAMQIKNHTKTATLRNLLSVK